MAMERRKRITNVIRVNRMEDKFDFGDIGMGSIIWWKTARIKYLKNRSVSASNDDCRKEAPDEHMEVNGLVSGLKDDFRRVEREGNQTKYRKGGARRPFGSKITKLPK